MQNQVKGALEHKRTRFVLKTFFEDFSRRKLLEICIRNLHKRLLLGRTYSAWKRRLRIHSTAGRKLSITFNQVKLKLLSYPFFLMKVHTHAKRAILAHSLLLRPSKLSFSPYFSKWIHFTYTSLLRSLKSGSTSPIWREKQLLEEITEKTSLINQQNHQL